MFSAWTGLRTAPKRKDRSPFSTPYTGLLSSPAAARRSSLEERRRPAADFDHGLLPNMDGKIDGEPQDEEQDQVDDEDQNEDTGEDGYNDMTPLLPIFSAAHLGSCFCCEVEVRGFLC